ncbi:hypothetical protein C8R44DRAFT_893760 [Mycena epipterygia]|nr:hypothetical protein C8R44DRAFT_893760 [Mycena epipterygia]
MVVLLANDEDAKVPAFALKIDGVVLVIRFECGAVKEKMASNVIFVEPTTTTSRTPSDGQLSPQECRARRPNAGSDDPRSAYPAPDRTSVPRHLTPQYTSAATPPSKLALGDSNRRCRALCSAYTRTGAAPPSPHFPTHPVRAARPAEAPCPSLALVPHPPLLISSPAPPTLGPAFVSTSVDSLSHSCCDSSRPDEGWDSSRHDPAHSPRCSPCPARVPPAWTAIRRARAAPRPARAPHSLPRSAAPAPEASPVYRFASQRGHLVAPSPRGPSSYPRAASQPSYSSDVGWSSRPAMRPGSAVAAIRLARALLAVQSARTLLLVPLPLLIPPPAQLVASPHGSSLPRPCYTSSRPCTCPAIPRSGRVSPRFLPTTSPSPAPRLLASPHPCRSFRPACCLARAPPPGLLSASPPAGRTAQDLLRNPAPHLDARTRRAGN